MTADEVKTIQIVKDNPKHFSAAMEAAAWSVFSNDRVRGIPQFRDQIVQVAALKSLGYVGKESLTPEVADFVNRVVVQQAINRAKDAAVEAIFHLGPIKRKLI